MIESRITLTGQATGFATGDRVLELAWAVGDGVGQFERFEVGAGVPIARDVGAGATIVIFVPGAATELEAGVASAKETLTNFVPDPEADEAANEAAKKQLVTAVAEAEAALETGAAVTVGWEAGAQLPISGLSATVLTAKPGEAARQLTIGSDQTLDGCELIVL